MKIAVLGGDGYCGWATALYLSKQGHSVAIVDNFVRRLWDHELNAQTLTPIRPLSDRLRVWQAVSGKTIESFYGDVCDYEFLASTLRAFLSNKYRPLDNVDLGNAVIPLLLEPGWRIVSAQITETRFYIQAVSSKLEAEVKHAQQSGRKGDMLQPGVVITNSEVGHGRLDVASLVMTLSCLNGMVAGSALRRNHVGRANGSDRDYEDAWEVFSDEARQADDRALWLKVRDTVKAAVNEALFFKLVEKLNAATGDRIEDPAATVEVTAKRFALSEGEQNSVLEHLARGGDLTRYGLLNAVTRTAEDAARYDRAIELERIGGEILELPASTLTPLN